MDKCEKLFDDYNIKPVMGVIPNNKDEILKTFLKEKILENCKRLAIERLEISMHGYNHLYNQNTNKKIISNMEENLNFLVKH